MTLFTAHEMFFHVQSIDHVISISRVQSLNKHGRFRNRVLPCSNANCLYLWTWWSQRKTDKIQCWHAPCSVIKVGEWWIHTHCNFITFCLFSLPEYVHLLTKFHLRNQIVMDSNVENNQCIINLPCKILILCNFCKFPHHF